MGNKCCSEYLDSEETENRTIMKESEKLSPDELIDHYAKHLPLVVKIQSKARSYIAQRKFRSKLMEYVQDRDRSNSEIQQNVSRNNTDSMNEDKRQEYYTNANHINLHHQEMGQAEEEKMYAGGKFQNSSNDMDQMNPVRFTSQYLNFYKESSTLSHMNNPKVIEVLNNVDNYRYLDSQTSSEREELISREPLEMPDGSIYEGQWSQDNKRHGRGKCIWKNGAVYEGNWENNFPEGHGRIIHEDGDMYEGFWRKGKAHGEGIFIKESGAKYFGIWINDKQNGYGKEKWTDGTKFEGLYVNGKKEGYGKLQWPDGSIYEGDFKNNIIDGYGKQKTANNSVYQGEWKDGKREGKGIFKWADGRQYEGEYKNDKKNGKGIFTYPNGERYEGEWFNGKQNGAGKLVKSDGTEQVGRWNMGNFIQQIHVEYSNLVEH